MERVYAETGQGVVLVATIVGSDTEACEDDDEDLPKRPPKLTGG